MSIPLDSVPRFRRGVGFRRVGSEGVLLVSETSEAIVTNGTGTRIFELVDARRSVKDIVDVLHAEFEASPEELEEQVRAFLERAAAGKMIDLDLRAG